MKTAAILLLVLASFLLGQYIDQDIIINDKAMEAK